MGETVAKLRLCRFGISRMMFRTNLQTTGREIPLASFVDLSIDDKAVFGCTIRKSLAAEEIEALPKSWRPQLAQPARYLFDAFLKAAEAHGKDGRLGFLSETYYASLYAAPIRWLPRPTRLVAPIPDDAVRQLAEEIVLRKLMEEEIDFLAPQPAVANIDYQQEHVKKAA